MHQVADVLRNLIVCHLIVAGDRKSHECFFIPQEHNMLRARPVLSVCKFADTVVTQSARVYRYSSQSCDSSQSSTIHSRSFLLLVIVNELCPTLAGMGSNISSSLFAVALLITLVSGQFDQFQNDQAQSSGWQFGGGRQVANGRPANRNGPPGPPPPRTDDPQKAIARLTHSTTVLGDIVFSQVSGVSVSAVRVTGKLTGFVPNSQYSRS